MAIDLPYTLEDARGRRGIIQLVHSLKITVAVGVASLGIVTIILTVRWPGERAAGLAWIPCG